ncbi:MAG TPA: UDP-N-acetylmuramate dehydrogenase [Flavisolibacter sp.]|nr:UDP-N-acetylmuramate dehydrogenase [Flavisolibacter sp.]
MQLQQQVNLQPYNTFGIQSTARYFTRFRSVEELAEALETEKELETEKSLILGGGSNILLTGNVDGMVMKNEIGGISVLSEDEKFIYIKAGAGKNWHQFVMYCVNKGYAGIENLSLIPGNIGASPMQNIGAYGVEIKDVFHELTAYHIHEHSIHTFGLKDCAFGYRESVFKGKYRNQFVILDVTYRLNKKPLFNTSYGAINQELEHMGVKELSIQAISQAVINIRTSKLPDPGQIGNAGSFFKNPIIEQQLFHQIKEAHPSVPSFPVDEQHIKLPAGWLIEQCGWKGYRKGDAGCYPKQALVLVNYGNAKGQEIWDLSEEIIRSVKQKFHIDLEREVNII